MLVQRNGDVVDVAAPVMLGQNRLSVVRVGFSNKGIQNTISGMIKGLNDGLDKAVSTAINNVLLAAIIVGHPAHSHSSAFIKQASCAHL